MGPGVAAFEKIHPEDCSVKEHPLQRKKINFIKGFDIYQPHVVLHGNTLSPKRKCSTTGLNGLNHSISENCLFGIKKRVKSNEHFCLGKHFHGNQVN